MINNHFGVFLRSNDRFLQILMFTHIITLTIVWVKNEPRNIYFEGPNQFMIKFNAETCPIEGKRIHVGRNVAAEEFSIFQLNIDGVKRHQKLDTHL